ncbi:hypothetical protein HanRHA438_Chr01g0028641 [Helianthus annuus]|nr:hypothetical protein HanRHA438_Chr01g0028641 [Helianthus annuus]
MNTSWNSRNLVQVDPNLSLMVAKSCLPNVLHLLGHGPDLNVLHLNLNQN